MVLNINCTFSFLERIIDWFIEKLQRKPWLDRCRPYAVYNPAFNWWKSSHFNFAQMIEWSWKILSIFANIRKELIRSTTAKFILIEWLIDRTIIDEIEYLSIFDVFFLEDTWFEFFDDYCRSINTSHPLIICVFFFRRRRSSRLYSIFTWKSFDRILFSMIY